MFLSNNKSEIYWNSYRLLENRLLELSHSIRFDDQQINVHSTEIADIIISICTKIESVAKDIYENHIWPFQKDNKEIPSSFSGKTFKVEKWTRKEWKFDYNCIKEIDLKFGISKKEITLRLERFSFEEYGNKIFPFFDFDSECNGGKWEYGKNEALSKKIITSHYEDIPWAKSYQALKHNYIESIEKHGTIKNAIMSLAALFVLLVYFSCLPYREFEVKYENKRLEVDFDSKLFTCTPIRCMEMDCIKDSDYEKYMQEHKRIRQLPQNQHIPQDQYYYEDYDCSLLVMILSQEKYQEVKCLVEEYCKETGLPNFDLALYEGDNAITDINDKGKQLYDKIKKIISPPFSVQNLRVVLNVGKNKVYEWYSQDKANYQASKYTNHKAEEVKKISIGDRIDFIYHNKHYQGEIVTLLKNFIEIRLDNGIKYGTPIEYLLDITKI